MRKILGILTVGFCLSSSTVWAEPQKADSFYEHNYAGRIMSDGSEAPRPARKPKAQQSEGAAQQPVEGGIDSSSFVAPQESPSPTPASIEQTEDPREKLQAAKIKRLGLIVSGSNDAHFSDTMEKLLNVSLARDIPIGKVIMVGPFNNPKRKGVFLGIGVQGGKTMGVDEVPSQYPVTKSPTWIVTLDKGEVLLEGFADIERFLNSKNEFVENIGAAL